MSESEACLVKIEDGASNNKLTEIVVPQTTHAYGQRQVQTLLTVC